MAGFKNKAPRTGFNRPTATAGVVVDRVWKDVYPEALAVGDIVAGLGAVTDIIATADCRNQVWLEAGLPTAKEYFLDNDVLVKAFVRKDS
jgi:hypothetical protein